MHILLKGISHKKAPLLVREVYSLSSRKKYYEKLVFLRNQPGHQGGMILSTCNRVEVYLITGDAGAGRDILDNVMYHGVAEDNIDRTVFYESADEEAVRHLFRVVCGLDSQVLGETQIMAQIRSAWECAREFDLGSPFLDKLIQSALIAARRAHSDTDISRGNVSVGSVAMKKCHDHFKNLNDKKVLILGAGKAAHLMASYLKKNNMHAIFVSNRTYDAAARLADLCNGEAIRFDLLSDRLNDVDIIISSTSAAHLLIKHQHIVSAMNRRSRPLFIIDLGVPRDIEPSVRDINGVSLYDMDDLKNVVEENFSLRADESVKVDSLIAYHCKRFFENCHEFRELKEQGECFYKVEC